MGEKTTEDTKDPTTEALEKFERKANALFDQIDGAWKSIEQRLTLDANRRADEQSKVMQAYEVGATTLAEDVRKLRALLDEHSKTLGKLGAGEKDVKRRIGESTELVRATLTKCEGLDAKAGERFGKRLEALGAQVSGLVTMGQRLEVVERKAAAANRMATDVAAVVETKLGELERIGRDLRSVMDQMTAPPPAKPTADAEKTA